MFEIKNILDTRHILQIGNYGLLLVFLVLVLLLRLLFLLLLTTIYSSIYTMH